jgi:hypothetical protein
MTLFAAETSCKIDAKPLSEVRDLCERQGASRRSFDNHFAGIPAASALPLRVGGAHHGDGLDYT